MPWWGHKSFPVTCVWCTKQGHRLLHSKWNVTREGGYFATYKFTWTILTQTTVAYTLGNVEQTLWFEWWNPMLPTNHITIWDGNLLKPIFWNILYPVCSYWLDPENVIGFESGNMKNTVKEVNGEWKHQCFDQTDVSVCTSWIVKKNTVAGFRVPFTCGLSCCTPAL